MFSSISWQLFFTAISAMAIAYYLFIGMVYFPKEILTFFLGKRNRVEPAAALQPTQDRQFINVLGRSGGERSGDNDYFTKFQSASSIHEKEAETHNPQPSDITLIEGVSNLMEGIKTLFRVIDDSDGNQEDVVTLFPSLLEQYPLIAGSKYRYSINAFIHELCTEEYKYDITLQEVNALWPSLPSNE